MRIGCVKEIKKQEYRVGMTPDNARSYVEAGHDVYVEAGLGLGSGFTDEEYERAGARMIETARAVWDHSEMMVKVKEPLPEEYPLFHEGLILYTYLHLAADRPLTEALLKSQVKGIAYETLMEKNNSLPLSPGSDEPDRWTVEYSGRREVS